MKKIGLIITILAAMLVWQVARSESIPDGVSVETSPAGELVVSVEKGSTVVVRLAESNHSYPILGIQNTNGKMHVLQINEGGGTPFGMDIFSANKAKILITQLGDGPSHLLTRIIDENGDGIPDLKIEDGRGYRLKSIEWEPINAPKEE